MVHWCTYHMVLEYQWYVHTVERTRHVYVRTYMCTLVRTYVLRTRIHTRIPFGTIGTYVRTYVHVYTLYLDGSTLLIVPNGNHGTS
jgi:hypothetical protein